MSGHRNFTELRDQLLDTPEKRDRHDQAVRDLAAAHPVVTRVDASWVRERPPSADAAVTAALGSTPATIAERLPADWQVERVGVDRDGGFAAISYCGP